MFREQSPEAAMAELAAGGENSTNEFAVAGEGSDNSVIPCICSSCANIL